MADKTDILLEEYKYAAESSMQTQKDRLTIVNFYLILFTAVIAAGFTISGKNYLEADMVKTVLFFSMGLISIVFIVFLARLRQAWFGSVRVMNHIKEYYRSKDKEISKHLLWTTASMPKPERLKTVSSLSALLISSLGTVCVFIGTITTDKLTAAGLIGSILYFFVCYGLYFAMLKFDK